MNIAEITQMGQDIACMSHEYTGQPRREMLIDPAVYAYLHASGVRVERQVPARRKNGQPPGRIDFRVGGSNPVLMELAVRPATGGGHLYGSQNTSELRKLCRVTPAKARLRALLLSDLYKTPLPSERLKATYDVVHAGRGRFSRTAVRVVYTHAEIAYNFLWRPFRQ